MRNVTLAWVHIMAGSMLCLTIFVRTDEIFFGLNQVKVTERASSWYARTLSGNLGRLVLPLCSPNERA
jgi:hypothetical protein